MLIDAKIKAAKPSEKPHKLTDGDGLYQRSVKADRACGDSSADAVTRLAVSIVQLSSARALSYTIGIRMALRRRPRPSPCQGSGR